MKNVKKIASSVLAMLLFTACGAGAGQSSAPVKSFAQAVPAPEAVRESAAPASPEPSPQPQADTARKPLAETLCGYYREAEPTEEGEHEILVACMAGTLLIDNYLLIDGEVYSFWLQEIRPENTRDLFDEGVTELRGKNLSFSDMSNAGMYWNPASELVIQPAQGGIILTEILDGQRTQTVFERIEPETTFRSLTDEQRRVLYDLDANPTDQMPSGTWCYSGTDQEGWLDLRADGSFLCAKKEKDTPIMAYVGRWGVNSDSMLVLAGQQLGSSDVPLVNFCEWSIAQDTLYQFDGKRDRILDNESPLAMFTAEEDWTFDGSFYG